MRDTLSMPSLLRPSSTDIIVIMNEILSILKCPVCGGSLTRVNKSLVCGSRHTFDISKSGYVNMLPPGKGKNSRTGDESDMVRARVDFLGRGYYERISAGLADLIMPYANECADCVTLADMGCGVGWHTVKIAERLAEKLPEKQILTLGFDASKYAAECASKLARSKNLIPRDGIGAFFDGNASYFMPANIFELPLRDNSVDFAVSMFAPVAGDEAHRILRKGGILAVVSSARDHLIEMRQTIYNEVHISDFLPKIPEGFQKKGVSSLRYSVTLVDPNEIASLFMMTPFYYKTSAEGRERLFSKNSIDLTVNVNYSIFEAI